MMNANIKHNPTLTLIPTQIKNPIITLTLVGDIIAGAMVAGANVGLPFRY